MIDRVPLLSLVESLRPSYVKFANVIRRMLSRENPLSYITSLRHGDGGGYPIRNSRKEGYNTESTARENRGGFVELGNCNKFRRIDHPL